MYMTIGQQDVFVLPGSLYFCRARVPPLILFLLFFSITLSIFGISQLFLHLNLLENSNEKNAYKPSFARAPVFHMFRKLYLFECISFRVSAFEAGHVPCCVIVDKWLVKCSTYFSLTLCSFRLERIASVLG